MPDEVLVALKISRRERKIPTPFFTNPRTVTARKTAIAMTAVTAIWDVVVNDIGKRPRKFDRTMNINNVIMYGKYGTASRPATSSTILCTNPYASSPIDCALPGTSALLDVPTNITKTRATTLKPIHKVTFVTVYQ